MTCIEITAAMVVRDTGNFEERLFQANERFTIVGEPIQKGVGCGCGDGSVIQTTFYNIVAGPNNRTFQINGNFAVIVDCASQAKLVNPPLAKRLSDVSSIPIDPRTNTVIDIVQDDNYHPNAERVRFNKMATFDLRRR